MVGASSGLSRERRQAAVVIPAALVRELGGLLRGHATAGRRMLVLLSGLAAATGGYLAGRAAWLAAR